MPVLATAMRHVRWWYHHLKVDRLLGFISDLRTAREVPRTRMRYAETLKHIRARARTGKIRVLFLSSDCSKWKVQSLYDRMKASEWFEPMVALSIYGWHDDRAMAESRLEKSRAFFAIRGMPVEFAYDVRSRKAISLNVFTPDIVFYDQPWDILPEHDPVVVSSFALTGYVPYMTPNLSIVDADCAMGFHRTIFRHFILSEGWADLCRNVRGTRTAAGEIVSVGHPMLDVYDKIDASTDGDLVIYAPHWTFPHKDNPNFLNISTFLWTGRAMLDYAQKHPEIKWAFKPHPVLKGMLVKSGVMTATEVDAYYAEWERIGESCYTGDYPNLFKRSRALVTDCASFLTEYACTGKPIVRLISPQAKLHPCELSERLYSTYYQVRKIEELEPVLDDLLVKGNDPNREARLTAAKAMNLSGTDAAGNIIRHLEELIFGEGAGEKEA